LLLERTADLAETCGDAESAGTLRRELGKPAAAQTAVVVVGETKRGKSSLINALLGRERLLPVDADVATSVHLAIHHATRPGARVTLGREAGPEVVDVDLEAIGDFASVAGNPGNEKDVVSVEIGLPDPLLAQGLTLVDTPGVGGLEAGHAAITLAQLAHADALLFVLDATAPLTAGELQFLLSATERIETVIFALTKIEAFPGWQQILEEDRTLVARHAPRYKECPFVPVSNLLKASADAAAHGGEGETAQDLLAESRFPALVDLLQTTVVGRAETLRVANRARLAVSVLADVEHDEQRRRRSAAGDPTLGAELEAEHARYSEFARAEARWRFDLAQQFTELQVDAGRELERALAELRKRAEAQIEGRGPDLSATLPRDLADALEGRWLDLNTILQVRSEQILEGLARTFELEGARIGVGDLALPERLRDLPEMRRSAEPAGERSMGALLAEYWPGVATSFTRKAILTSVGVAAGGFTVMGLLPLMAGGVAVQKVMGVHRKQLAMKTRSQTDARKFVAETLQDAGIELRAELQKRLARTRGAIEQEVGTRLGQRKEALTTAVEHHRRALKTAQSERAQAEAAANRNLAQVAELGQEAKGLLRDLDAGEGAPGQAADARPAGRPPAGRRPPAPRTVPAPRPPPRHGEHTRHRRRRAKPGWTRADGGLPGCSSQRRARSSTVDSATSTPHISSGLR
jgi:hypothetical protein